MLVSLALFELIAFLVTLDSGGQTAVLRLARLTRISRVLRLLRLEFFSELSMMIQGALGGMRTFMWACLLLLLLVYFVAFIFRQSIGMDYDDDDENAASGSTYPF